MDNIVELRNQANNYRKAKNYTAALPIYRQLWEEHRQSCNEWDGWGYAFCLEKTKNYQQGLVVAREVYSMKPDFELIRSVYAWCIYHLEISKKTDEEIKQNESRFFKAACAIIDLVKPGQYTPYIRTVLKVVDYLKKSKPAFPAKDVLTWLDRLNPDELSIEPGKGKRPDGRDIEYASDREKWYTTRCQALFALERYQECIDFGKKSINSLSRFHHDNDLWIRYRVAHAKAKLGDLESALQDLLHILTKKQDWFIQKDIAEIHWQLGRPEEALRYAAAGALAPGDLEFKWELFFLLGKLLMETKPGQPEIARHILLAAKVRQEQGWKIPEELGKVMRDLKIELESAPDSVTIARELKGYWTTLRFAGKTLLKGKIKNLVAGGKSGFIIDDAGEEFYFSVREFKGKYSALEVGLPVEFFVERAKEPGKKDIAVFIREIEK